MPSPPCWPDANNKGGNPGDVRTAKIFGPAGQFTVQNTPKFSVLRGSSQMPITGGGGSQKGGKGMDFR